MNREEIVQAVQSYIRNENEKYALLINGAWGSGKTFLYENYLCDAISDIERFKKNVLVYSVIINNIFGVQIAEDFLKNSEISVSKLGIETLAGILYKYIKGNKNNVWTDNDEYRLQDLITCICITSIFYVRTEKLDKYMIKARCL